MHLRKFQMSQHALKCAWKMKTVMHLNTKLKSGLEKGAARLLNYKILSWWNILSICGIQVLSTKSSLSLKFFPKLYFEQIKLESKNLGGAESCQSTIKSTPLVWDTTENWPNLMKFINYSTMVDAASIFQSDFPKVLIWSHIFFWLITKTKHA